MDCGDLLKVAKTYDETNANQIKTSWLIIVKVALTIFVIEL